MKYDYKLYNECQIITRKLLEVYEVEFKEVDKIRYLLDKYQRLAINYDELLQDINKLNKDYQD